MSSPNFHSYVVLSKFEIKILCVWHLSTPFSFEFRQDAQVRAPLDMFFQDAGPSTNFKKQ